MYFTLQGAADATGKAKTTIQPAIKTGKLSANRNENGSYAIDAAELSRVYVLRDTGSDTAAIDGDAYPSTKSDRDKISKLPDWFPKIS